MKIISQTILGLFLAGASARLDSDYKPGAYKHKVPLTLRHRQNDDKLDVTARVSNQKKAAVQSLAGSYTKDVTWAPDYIGNIYVGTPGQQMDIVFDSGSGMLIVATDECTDCQPVKNANGVYDRYQPSLSSTAFNMTQLQTADCQAVAAGYTNQQFESCPILTYGSAYVHTNRFNDTVCFNGDLASGDSSIDDSQCVTDYPVFAITQAQGISGGIMGLTPACGGLAPDCTPFVQEMYNQGQINEPIIAFNLGQDSLWLKNMTASIDMGGTDESYINGQIHYLDGYTSNYWAPVGNGMYYDGVTIDPITSMPPEANLTSGNYKMAVLDTGTSLMALSENLIAKMNTTWAQQANAAGCGSQNAGGFFIVDCGCNTVVDKFSNFDFVVNGDTQITMSPYAYLQEIFGPGYCAVAISSIPASVSGMNMYLLGDTFLRHFYTIFNYSVTSGTNVRQIGLALNSQYTQDGYTNSFADSDGSMNNYYVKLQNTPDPMSESKKYNTVQSLTVVFTVFLYMAGYLYQNAQMSKRVSMKKIKVQAATGFKDAENLITAK